MIAQIHSRRILAACGALLIACCGLAIRRASFGPPLIRDFAPDALWALMIFCLAFAIWPHLNWRRIAAFTLGFCIVIEGSQLLRLPVLEAIRATPVGALVLGRGFLWSDIVCYAAGVAGGCFLAAAIERHFAQAPVCHTETP